MLMFFGYFKFAWVSFGGMGDAGFLLLYIMTSFFSLVVSLISAVQHKVKYIDTIK